MGKVLHASGSGYFPYCLTEGDPDPSVDYVAEMSLGLAMAIFWRAKRIKWYGMINWPTANWNNLPWHIEISSSASDESQLVCNPIWTVTSSQNLIDGSGSPFVVGSPAGWLAEPFYFKEGSQSTLINTDLGLSGFFVEGTILGFTLSSYFDGLLTESYFMNFANAGTLVLQGQFPYAGDGTPPDDYTATLDHEIEYWSYDGTYDTSTGLPL
jgi:uncharacterized membrane protein YeaQ/YmgE (transglycosylase-associated protein family)